MTPPRIVFMGTPDFAVPSLDALVEAGLSPVAVVTVPDTPAGRGQKVRASAVKQAAERRGLAAQQAGLETVPCQVRLYSDQQVYETAMEENLKRENLNPLEQAQAFRRYLDEFDSTIDQLAARLSMNRSTWASGSG